ncbi:MAG TPA: hypothetical protein VIC05_05065 [Solirubrobacteraceae bacterium]|jgi:hypothetical protein
MLRGLAVLAVVLVPARAAAAAPQDVASTHAYLVASHDVLHSAIATWSRIEAGIHKLNAKFRGECADAGAGSPQNEEGQALSTEAAGALWASGYHTEAKIVRAYIRALNRLRWSNPTITRSDRRLAKSMGEMLALKVPNLCEDIHAWKATGFTSMPASAKQYAKHVEAIEIKEIPQSLLRRYLAPTDRGLLAQTERLARKYEELEISRGQVDWNMLLETLGLNQ